VSRGHGRIERAVLAAVAEPDAAAVLIDGRAGREYDGTGAVGVVISRLAGRIFAAEVPTRSERVSVRRAIANLKGRGLVETVRVSDPDGGWNARYVTAVRRLPTADELARRIAADRRVAEWAAALRSSRLQRGSPC